MKELKEKWIKLIKRCGWRLILPEEGSRREMERCIFVVAPHTSSLDFVTGAAYLWACCPNGKVLMKKELFWWPLGWFLRKVGGIPVDRKSRDNGIIATAVREFAKGEPLSIAITPEATRKPTDKWNRGFWLIAKRAKVPIVPTYIDFEKKEIGAFDTIEPSDDYEADLKKIRSLYKARMAKHPEDFIELKEQE